MVALAEYPLLCSLDDGSLLKEVYQNNSLEEEGSSMNFDHRIYLKQAPLFHCIYVVFVL